MNAETPESMNVLDDTEEFGAGHRKVRAQIVVHRMAGFGHLCLEDVGDKRHAPAAACSGLRLRLEIRDVVDTLLNACTNLALQNILEHQVSKDTGHDGTQTNMTTANLCVIIQVSPRIVCFPACTKDELRRRHIEGFLSP
jgi:hypothetical protein